jgi:hypothetical protein
MVVKVIKLLPSLWGHEGLVGEGVTPFILSFLLD